MPRFATLLCSLLLLSLALPGPGSAAPPDFSPASFYGLPAPALRGPEQARGLLIWNHGTDALAEIDQAPVLAWYFAQRGWDVYRLYRGPGRDRREAAAREIQAGIAQARALGYRRILLLGHSAGAYTAVQVAQDTPVDGVIVLAPASFGHARNSIQFHLNDYAMRPFWRRLAAQPVRIAAAYFPQDIFYEADLPATRGPWLRQLLQQQPDAAAHLVIDRPDLPDASGHGSGLGWSFARRYAPCIHRLMDALGAADCNLVLPEDTAVFASAAPQDTAAALTPYLGRWRDASGGRDAFVFDILRDPTGMPLLRFSLPEQGSSDWPMRVTVDAARSETAAGQFEFRHEGDGMVAVLRRPGDTALPQKQWRLRPDQPLSVAGLKSSATPLMQ